MDSSLKDIESQNDLWQSLLELYENEHKQKWEPVMNFDSKAVKDSALAS